MSLEPLDILSSIALDFVRATIAFVVFTVVLGVILVMIGG
jgi:hypothetical protein